MSVKGFYDVLHEMEGGQLSGVFARRLQEELEGCQVVEVEEEEAPPTPETVVNEAAGNPETEEVNPPTTAPEEGEPTGADDTAKQPEAPQGEGRPPGFGQGE